MPVALLRQATYGTIKIGIYESMKPFASNFLPANTLPNNMLCAAVAGTVSSCLATPTDVLKVRQQASGLVGQSERWSGSLPSLFRSIYAEEGIRGMWRGVGPTAQRATLVCTVQLPSYEAAKRLLNDSGYSGNSAVCHLLSSVVAGVASAAACNPVDVVKNRMMNQHLHASGSGLYVSSLDCLMKTLLAEGPAALWKGFVPNCMRLGPWNVIFFMSMEQMKNLNQTAWTNWDASKKLDSVVALATTSMEADI